MSLTFGSAAPMAIGVIRNSNPQKAFLVSSSSNSRSFNLSHRRGLCVGYNNLEAALGRSRTLSKTAVAATDQLSSSDPAQQVANNKYYFLVANAKFMLDEEEHFREQLFERLRYYGERSKELDFWLVIEPKFLDKFPDITKRLGRPAVALVSTNKTWITFMKLRLDRVLGESYEANNVEEALASNPVKIEFQKPENWVAPYPKYESGWWETFLPPKSE